MYTVCVYIYRDHVLVEAHLQYVHDSYISQRQRKKQAEKRALSQKMYNKDHFRCLITIWNIGIARRGLNELKTWNLTKIYIFTFLCL